MLSINVENGGCILAIGSGTFINAASDREILLFAVNTLLMTQQEIYGRSAEVAKKTTVTR